MTLYKSQAPIWWNKGNEFKPTYTDFKNIIWDEVPNFTVNWLSETQIQITCGINDTFDLVKIVAPEIRPNSKDNIKYYYLVGIISKTKLNKVCIFELDIWSTYFLETENQTSDFNLQKIKMYSNIKYELNDIVENNTVAETATITPAGILTDKVKKVSLLQRKNVNWNDMSCGLGSFSTNALCGTLYFVFNTSQDRYVFIPCTTFETNRLRENNAAWVDLPGYRNSVFKNVCLSNDANANEYRDLAWENVYQDFHSLIQSTEYNYQNPLWNKNNGQPKWININSLVGVYLGPHITTLKIKKWISIKNRKVGINLNAPYLISVPSSSSGQQITLQGSSDKVYKAWTSNTAPIPDGENIFIGFEMTSEGIEIKRPGNEVLELWKKGYTIYDNPNLNTYYNATRLYFTDKMIFSSPSNSLELFTEVPYFVSSYFETLRRQRETLDTSYHLQNVNAISSFVGSVAPALLPRQKSQIFSNMEMTKDHFINPVLSSQTISREKTNSRLHDTYTKNEWAFGKTTPLTTRKKSIVEQVSSVHPAMKAIQIGAAAVNTGIQLYSNYAHRKAFFRDLRNSATVNTTTASAASLSNALLLFSTTMINGWSEESTSLNPTPLVGYELYINNTWYSLYGYETNYYIDNSQLTNIGKTGNRSIFTLRVPESLEISFTMRYENILSPTIREAIWVLLVQGVVIVSKDKLSNALSAHGGSNELFNT